MGGAFTAVDLSRLPVPAAVESLDFETILAAMIADLMARAPEFNALVESDPAFKILEVAAYRELLLRQRVNESVKAVMLAYAIGSDLDQLAANNSVQRLMIDAGDPDAIPPIPPEYEADESLRRRVQLSFEGFSTAGPAGAYIFHALGADAGVLDVAVACLVPGTVSVAVLSRTGDGTAAAELLASVDDVLNAEDIRPLTDTVEVDSAVIVNYTISATLTTFAGPDAEVVMATAQAAIEEYATKNHRIGRDITLSGIYAALHQEGVQNVTLTAPAASIVSAWNQANYCTAIILINGGTSD